LFHRFVLTLGLLIGLASPLRAEPAEFDIEAMLAAAPVSAIDAPRQETGRITALAVGAVAGVVALNFYMGGLAYLPFTGVVAATPLATAESIVAISRVYAVAAAAAGALVGNYVYERSLLKPESASLTR
jgi:hypothetical protein